MQPLQDDYRHKGMRRKLVDLLRTKGVTDENVLKAIGQVPRHQFIDGSAFLEMAYADTAFPIGHDQTISQPYTVAFQSALLQVEKGMKVLEIGTGSGYQTAVLAAMGARVFSVERIKPLYTRTRRRLEAMGVRASLHFGDGHRGLPHHAPFHRILVTCGAPEVPLALQEQLKPGGRLVIPVGQGGLQVMTLVERAEDGTFTTSRHGSFRFVPMLGERTH